MVYIPFWICIFAGVAIDALERRFPNGLAGACAVAALAGVWLDLGLNTALDHAGLAVIVYLGLVLTESLWRRVRHAPGLGMGDVKALFALCTFDPQGGVWSSGTDNFSSSTSRKYMTGQVIDVPVSTQAKNDIYRTGYKLLGWTTDKAALDTWEAIGADRNHASFDAAQVIQAAIARSIGA